LGKSNDMLNIATQGTADMSIVVMNHVAGEIPLSMVLNLPHYTSSVEGAEIARKMFNQSSELQEQFAQYNVRAIAPFNINQYDLGTVNKPIESPEDLAGLQIITSGGLFDQIASAYGAEPVSMPGTDAYESIERNIAEGSLFTLGSV